MIIFFCQKKQTFFYPKFQRKIIRAEFSSLLAAICPKKNSFGKQRSLKFVFVYIINIKIRNLYSQNIINSLIP